MTPEDVEAGVLCACSERGQCLEWCCCAGLGLRFEESVDSDCDCRSYDPGAPLDRNEDAGAVWLP